MVIYSAQPVPQPILAIEFDGVRNHSGIEAISRDNLKTALLASLGIPLLRISSRDSEFVSWQTASDAQHKKVDSFFLAVGSLVRWLVVDVVRERRENAEQEAEASRQFQALDKISQATFGKTIVDLTAEEQASVVKGEAYEEWAWQESIDQGMPIVKREEPPTSYQYLKVALSHLGIPSDRIRSYSAKHEGSTVQPIVQMAMPNGDVLNVEGPAVAIRLSATPQTFVDEAVLWAFKSVMAFEVEGVFEAALGNNESAQK